MFKTNLSAAIHMLKRDKKIKTLDDVAHHLGYNSKGTISAYQNGTTEISKEFQNKFENFYKLKLADFDGMVDKGDGNVAVRNSEPEEQDYKAKYIALLEEYTQEKKALEKRLESIEQNQVIAKSSLDKLYTNQCVLAAAHSEYQAYVIEVFWDLQGKKVDGRQVVKEIQQKAFDKQVQYEEHGIRLDI